MGIFGNWLQGDILNDNGALGAIRDNTGAHADVRNPRHPARPARRGTYPWSKMRTESEHATSDEPHR